MDKLIALIVLLLTLSLIGCKTTQPNTEVFDKITRYGCHYCGDGSGFRCTTFVPEPDKYIFNCQNMALFPVKADDANCQEIIHETE